MASGISFTVKKNTLPQASSLMRKAIGVGFNAVRPQILADTQRRTPVDTGELRSSEQATSDEQSLTVTVGAPHGIYVHQGARGRAARPFLRDAIEVGAPVAFAAIGKAAAEALG